MTRSSSSPIALTRRSLLTATGAAAASLAMPAVLRAAGPTLRIGYWPISAGLPFYAAVEEGYFKAAGVTVEVQRYAGAQQITEAMLAGRADGCANGTGSANQAIAELAQPGLIKFICSNPTNEKYVLDEIIVAKDSPYKTIADLAGKRVAGGPGIQNMTLARTVFEKAGAKGAQVVELPFGQHVAAIASGQIDAAYTLEPQGTIGRMNGTTRTLEAGVIARYILGDPMAPWHGGAASLTGAFLKDHPDEAKAYIAAYRKGVAYVRDNPEESRKYFANYTSISGDLVQEVPLSGYTMYDEFTPESVAYFQKFFDLFSDAGIFSAPLDVSGMIYKA
ncbi:ABC transporter substrate-binding protein [Acidimangrovimonas sediminis]|uniref:ABC transporter substrate-binding protein n=1 Tax=Acidimangrovimonas sediminis TaxID=2056283 RepID=UPI000C7FA97A|nr:ABC transporter substrate-binding protein [Acidimangrovimonas sediminis]